MEARVLDMQRRKAEEMKRALREHGGDPDSYEAVLGNINKEFERERAAMEKAIHIERQRQRGGIKAKLAERRKQRAKLAEQLNKTSSGSG